MSSGIPRLTPMVGHTFYNTTHTYCYIYWHAGSYLHLFMGVLRSAKYE